MKKMMIWITAIGFSIGSVIAQSPATSVTPQTNVQKIQPSNEVKPATNATMTKKPAHVGPVAVVNKKPHAKPAHVTPVHPVKKDGTPDKRFHANKKLKKDGTPDARYKENKAAGPGAATTK